MLYVPLIPYIYNIIIYLLEGAGNDAWQKERTELPGSKDHNEDQTGERERVDLKVEEPEEDPTELHKEQEKEQIGHGEEDQDEEEEEPGTLIKVRI